MSAIRTIEAEIVAPIIFGEELAWRGYVHGTEASLNSREQLRREGPRSCLLRVRTPCHALR